MLRILSRMSRRIAATHSLLELSEMARHLFRNRRHHQSFCAKQAREHRQHLEKNLLSLQQANILESVNAMRFEITLISRSSSGISSCLAMNASCACRKRYASSNCSGDDASSANTATVISSLRLPYLRSRAPRRASTHSPAARA